MYKLHLIAKYLLKRRIAWVEQFPPGFVVFVGSVEVAGALALVLPGLTGIWRILTPVAATGLAVLMALGAALHVSRKEYREMLTQEPWLFAAFVFIAWGRFGPYPL